MQSQLLEREIWHKERNLLDLCPWCSICRCPFVHLGLLYTLRCLIASPSPVAPSPVAPSPRPSADLALQACCTATKLLLCNFGHHNPCTCAEDQLQEMKNYFNHKLYPSETSGHYLPMNMHLQLDIVDENTLEVCHPLSTKPLQFLNSFLTKYPEFKFDIISWTAEKGTHTPYPG